jgi:tetratricopeptide (TPR) repeat protein
MGYMYQDSLQLDKSVECFKDALFKNIQIYGETHLQVNQCYQAIATAYSLQENYRMALEYQEKSHDILKKMMPPGSDYLLQSEK